MVGATLGLLTAQGDEFAFHVYVDPLYGDNEVAALCNPQVTGPTSKRPLATHPNSNWPEDLADNGEPYLQHAPYSFRTVTGPPGVGAIAYVSQQFFPENESLPWSNPDTGKTIVRVIIHCLPGLYGPYVGAQYDPAADIDPGSGFRYNGELFPVQLPDGVSIQGTSALDTIFDARGRHVAVFVFPGLGAQVVSHETTFIDGITIRRAMSDGQDLSPPPQINTTGAGIFLGIEGSPSPHITNCFFDGNTVGIALNADQDDASRPAPVIANNTFYDNAIGIWSGNQNTGQTNVGRALPIVINNIFDPVSMPAGKSPFNGLHPFDLQVLSAVPLPGKSPPLPASIDFNAWPSTTENRNAAANFPLPTLRPPVVAYAPPRVDLLPYLSTAVKPRGLLYVRESLFHGTGIDLSPHDYRLTPHVATDRSSVSTSTPIVAVNPLIDTGIDLNSYSMLTMANGKVLAAPPGSMAISGEFIEIEGWDWDAEGFGNPRIREYVYPVTPPPPPTPTFYGRIDIGADEIGELIMAGYVPHTRLYATQPTGASFPISTQTSVYFFNLLVGSPYPRPVFNSAWGQIYPWWDHTRLQSLAEGCPDCVDLESPLGRLQSNYTDCGEWDATTPTERRRLMRKILGPGELIWVPHSMDRPTPPGPYIPAFFWMEPIMRNLECDFSPHLLKDSHPFWGPSWFDQAATDPSNLVKPDIYASNPWYGSDFVLQGSFTESMNSFWPVPLFANDNWYLYSNPLHPNVFYASAVVDGHLNPPRTLRLTLGRMPVTGAMAFFLTESSAPSTFVPIGVSPCNTNDRYAIGPFGYGGTGSGCPDQVPLVFAGLGVRYNCQVAGTMPGEAFSNLQTFLTVIETSESQSGQGYSGPRMNPAALSERFTADELRAMSRLMGPPRRQR